MQYYYKDVTKEIKKLFGNIVIKATLSHTDTPRIVKGHEHYSDFMYEGVLTIEFVNGKKVEFEHSEFAWISEAGKFK